MKLVASLLVAATSAAVGVEGKKWLASSAPTAVVHSDVEFRGSYAGFDLLVAPDGHSFGQELAEYSGTGNDGLWVVEFDDQSMMAADMKLIEAGHFPVLHQSGLSIVVGGGIDLTDALGYDSCGANNGKRVISVPTTPVKAVEKRTDIMDRLMAESNNKDPRIEAVLALIEESNLEATIRELQSYNGRNSFSGNYSTSVFTKGSLDAAADWAAAQLSETGFEVVRDTFRSDITPQIIARLPGVETPENVVVMGAHLDSRGPLSQSATQRAPGADDNATGSAVLIEFARIIAASGIRFKNTLDLALFTGEEQGLIGSRAMASRYRAEGVNVIGMFNSDMVGYSFNGEVTLALFNRNVDADLTNLAIAISTTYVGDQGLTVGLTNVCCSDQQAFFEQGFASVGYFETLPASVVYPQYHQTNDELESGNINIRQVFLSGSATIATTMTYLEVM